MQITERSVHMHAMLVRYENDNILLLLIQSVELLYKTDRNFHIKPLPKQTGNT